MLQATWRSRIMAALMSVFIAGLFLNMAMEAVSTLASHMAPVVAGEVHVGQWATVLVTVAVMSFFLTAYLVPSGPGRRDWRSLGLVQAFLVALYAEMYGFPLTVYLIASAFGLPALPGLMGPLDGHLLALAAAGLGMNLAVATALIMSLSSLVMALGFICIYQGWTQIHGSDGQLVTTGIYQYVRHPQYLGIFLVTGALLIHWPTVVTVLMYPALMLSYVRLARREEAVMVETFGPAYVEYRQIVPAFWPRLRLA